MQQPPEVQTFLKTVCQQVRWKQAHGTITGELANHIEDQTEANLRKGMAEEEAVRLALREMGDPVEIGLCMDESYRPRMEWTVAVPLLILLVCGTVLQLAFYGAITHYEAYQGESFAKLGLSLGMGGLLAAFAYHINFYRLYKLSWAGYAFLCASLIWHATGDAVGLGYQGDVNWAYLTLLGPVFLAGVLYALRGAGVWRLIAANALCAVPWLYLLLWSGEDLFHVLPCLIACLVVLLCFLTSGAFPGKRRYVLLLSVLVWCGALLLLTFDWRQGRFNPFRYRRLADTVQRVMESNVDASANGVRETLEHAKLFGQGGLTAGAKELFFEKILWGEQVPGLEWCFMADYLITYLIYRLGWAAGLGAVAVLLAVLVFGYARCFRLESILGRLLGVSIMSVYAVQVLLYLLGCFGIAGLGVPFPLPFLSVGYRSQILNMALMGMLLSLFRTDGLVADRQPGKKPTPLAQ